MKSSVVIDDSCGSSRVRRCSGLRARWKRPLLATITRSVTSREHGVRRAPERTPRARAAGAGALLPDDLAAQQQTEPVLEDVDHVGREAPVRLAAEVGDVDGDPAARFEHTHTVGEHVVEQLQVLEIGARHAVALQLLLVLLAREVRRRRHDQRHRAVGDRVHPPGVADDERLLDGFRREHRGVVVEHGRLEPPVEPRGVVRLAPAHPEVGRGGATSARGRGVIRHRRPGYATRRAHRATISTLRAQPPPRC